MPKPRPQPSEVRRYIEDFSQHKVSFILSPTQWKNFKLHTALNWKRQLLEDKNISKIPTNRGVYAHSIRIEVPHMPPTDYVTYVGLVGDKKTHGPKGNRRHLQQRFKEYLREKDILCRPVVWEMLNQYAGYTWFHYAEVSDYSISLHSLETMLLDALLPPCNQEDFSINIKQAHQVVYRK
jgi:hypothetical protein